MDQNAVNGIVAQVVNSLAAQGIYPPGMGPALNVNAPAGLDINVPPPGFPPPPMMAPPMMGPMGGPGPGQLAGLAALLGLGGGALGGYLFPQKPKEEPPPGWPGAEVADHAITAGAGAGVGATAAYVSLGGSLNTRRRFVVQTVPAGVPAAGIQASVRFPVALQRNCAGVELAGPAAVRCLTRNGAVCTLVEVFDATGTVLIGYDVVTLAASVAGTPDIYVITIGDQD